jgi:chromosome segregation protein
MKIKRVEILGFKSFVEKTTISFTDPITAIVGPNGCGKSNVVDAIRWVMGEQSAKHLRGRAMEDVIFAGSETRGPAGMAEVSLTFDGGSLRGDIAPGGVPWGAVGPAEIVVTRRLHRDGESEYLLNGVPSRLRDVVEFFLGTGVGSKAYAIIEQGRIGFIVSSRPEDRRGLIDEAAGITKYKVKKKAAERRIESTRQHLLRVSDIIGEIEGRLRSLRLQAAKAERYKRYKAELRDLDLWSGAQRFLGHLAEEKSLLTDLEELGRRREDGATALEAEEASVEAERLAVGDELGELGTAKDHLFALSNRAQLALQRAQHQEEEAARLSARAESEQRETEELRMRQGEGAAAIEALEGQLAELDAAAATSGERYRETERAHEELRSALGEARRQLDRAQSELAQARARIARNESESAAASARREDLARRIEAIEAEAGGADQRLGDLAAEEETLRAGIEAIATRRRELSEARQESESRLAACRTELARGELELEGLREQLHRRRSRLASLGEIQERYESFQKGVRAIMQKRREQEARGEVSGVRTLVADILQPPSDLETAVESVLGDRLGNVVVESHAVSAEGIAFLKDSKQGRSSFIPLTVRDTAGFGSFGRSAPWPAGEGIRGPILELMGYDRAYNRVAEYLLGDVLVVDELPRALQVWGEWHASGSGTNPPTLVTLQGDVVDPRGAVSGGSRESTVGILEQKREIRELEQLVAELDARHRAAVARQNDARAEAAELQQVIDGLLTSLRADEMAGLSQHKDLERTREEQRRLESRRRQLASDREGLGRSLEEAELRIENTRAALEGDWELVEAAERRSGELRTEGLSLADRLDDLVGELTGLKVEAAQAQDRRNHARATLQRLLGERSQAEARLQRLEQSIGESLERAEGLRTGSVELREEGALAQGEAQALARGHAERQGLIEERSAMLSRREAELRVTRGEVQRMNQTHARLELRHQEVAIKRASLEEQVLTRYADVSLRDIVVDYHLRPPLGEAEEARMTELRGLLERMGEINLTAIEESEESQKRFDFLSAQRADLESAIGQLESAIEKINRASKKRFRETFDAIDAKFREVYPRMFGGGRAHLRLTDDGDLLETGVDIVANPPGKKVMQNIELLSGGEKALTAVSLLFAIFLVKPSPFCVLDEVDAPLDEANVGRFNDMVRAMTDRSQFIIISHNRRTMEIADRLCGITMEEAGVSKLVSVNLRSGSGGRASVLTESRGTAAPTESRASAADNRASAPMPA